VNTIAEQQYQFTTGNILMIILGSLIIAGACYALFARWDDAGRPKLW
jgi:putative chitinase